MLIAAVQTIRGRDGGQVGAAFDLIVDAERHAFARTQAVLTHPYLGVWTARRLRHGSVEHGSGGGEGPEGIAAAARDGAHAVVIELNTPGGTIYGSRAIAEASCPPDMIGVMSVSGSKPRSGSERRRSTFPGRTPSQPCGRSAMGGGPTAPSRCGTTP